MAGTTLTVPAKQPHKSKLTVKIADPFASQVVFSIAKLICVAFLWAPTALIQAQEVDLASLQSGFRISGFYQTAEADKPDCLSVSGAGDVNGDGLDDIIIGSRNETDSDGTLRAGAAFVIFGTRNTGDLNVRNLASRGFEIDGVDSFDNTGWSVAGAGDFNGDGLDDLVVGAPFAPAGNDSPGSAYVVFGRASSSRVDLDNLGASGFRIAGDFPQGAAGSSVAGTGDVNGDGLDDVIVGAPSAGAGGRAYVVFGKDTVETVDLGSVGDGGFVLFGHRPGGGAGTSVAGAGDVNGDGLDDLIIGAPRADPDFLNSTGASYLVLGKSTNTPVDLGLVGAFLIGSPHIGFRINGINSSISGSGSVAGAGDVNGDGLADLIIGSPVESAAHLVFGKQPLGVSPNIDLGDLGDGGFQISGPPGSRLGSSVAGAGDVNADGLDDLIVGARLADPSQDGAIQGESYLAFGKTGIGVVNVPLSVQQTYSVGGVRNGGVGCSVGSAGDFDGDGLPDLIIGAYESIGVSVVLRGGLFEDGFE